MKKAIIIFLGAVLVLTSLGIGGIVEAVGETLTAEEVLSPGTRSEEIEAIQEILKEDPSVYPEGYATGYYGPLTTNAIKRLQNKFNLPQTGVIDSETIELIFPHLKIKVLSPNGGESWNKNDIQTIKWTVVMPTTDEIAQKSKYFRPKASIDLFRRIRITTCPEVPTETEAAACKTVEKSVFVKHIAIVSLFDMAYSWKISSSVENGNDYVIRISTGRNITPALLEKDDTVVKQLWDIERNIYWDESDGTFTITGTTPEPHTPYLEEVIKILEEVVKELNRAIQLLKKI